MPTDINRIEEMERILNECNEATAALAKSLSRMDELREPMMRLFQYYGSDEWYADREAKLPVDVRAGVLSEDLPYNAIIDVREAAIRMLELATDILKNRI